jgi:hypothetical protein
MATVLDTEEIEKLRKTIEELSSVYWREIFGYGIPAFERGYPIMDQLKRARAKLDEVIR